MRPLPPQYDSAQALERHLGDPSETGSAISFARAVELDERDEYPEEACAALDRFGLQSYYIPVAHGGRLSSIEELGALARAVSRRDLTVAVAHSKTLLGAISIWLAGNPEQQTRVAEIVRGGGQIALALTEREHGGDLLAGEAAAIREGDGWLLCGEKWLINNATRSAAVTVLARTDEAGGRRGFSLFLVDKERLETRRYEHLPRIRTHGIRGADISGIRFDRCPLGADSLVGRIGGGLEILLAGFQVTRTFVSALSLGAADTALRTTLDFARSSRRYDEPILAIPHARQTLADAFIDLLICDSLATAATRGLHVATEQSSVGSAVVKYFVPTTLERTVRRLAVVLGARYYLREGHAWGIFQKVMRDCAIASLFDGSTVVNLGAIALEMGPLARTLARSQAAADPDLGERLRSTFCLASPLPAFAAGRLALASRGRNDVLQGLAAIQPLLLQLSTEPDLDPAFTKALALQVEKLLGALRACAERQEDWTPAGGSGERSAEGFALADRFCRLHAAAACVQMWLHNRRLLGEFFARGTWLVMALERLLEGLGHRPRASSASDVDELACELARRFDEGLLFGIAPLPLARPRSQFRSLEERP